MAEKDKITELSELGEFKLIEHLTSDVKLYNKTSLKGIGDDAAVIACGDEMQVLTTDMLIEGIHFNLVYTPLKHLGYKAVVVNLSDVYAMNAEPRQITISLAVSVKFSLEALEDLYAGIRLACEKYKVDLVGGDTTSSMSGLIISVTATGMVSRDKITYRNTAGKNDLICVTGDLGAAYAGLQLLERERKIYESDPNLQPDLKEYPYVLERQLKPEARKDIIEELEKSSIVPSSMIDLSDGLSSDLLHLCKQSERGCRIFQDKIPIDKETSELASELNIEPFICALNGGEDYELLFTVPVTVFDQIKLVGDVFIIGHMTDPDEGCKFVTREGNEIVLTAQGWDGLQ